MAQEKDWDIKAFPHLHNPNGSNGKDEDRTAKLTEQSYFIQRVLNKDDRFARCPAYKYSAVAYLEKRQLQRNINISGTRGKMINHNSGDITYELNDEYTVLEDIKNTPRYWKKVKNEMNAKLENLGAFQLFFTLSCADLRWEENFAAILHDRGLSLVYSVVKDQTGYCYNKIEVEHMKDGRKRKTDLMEFIREELNESLHELIRGNVLLATRYFNHRVKKFFAKIVMGKNNPMNVEYYTYKVEFQERGAGHIHGTLWLSLSNLENLVYSEDRKLIKNCDINSEIGSSEPVSYHPFKGIKSAFQRLKNNEVLLEEEKKALVNFVDEFTTVSTNESTVGADVAKIASEVNKHAHTRSCRKYDSQCRFQFPKFPSTKTIIAVPLVGLTASQKKSLIKEQR